MIVRFTSPTTRGFFSPLLSLFSLLAAKENLWDQGKINDEILNKTDAHARA